jgi:hypothetical protein
MLEYMAATEIPDPEKALLASAIMDKLEQFQVLPTMRKELSDAVESSTQTAEVLKGINEDRVEKFRDYGFWLEENGDPFSPSKEERMEGHMLRRDICELTTISESFESSLMKEIGNVRRLEKGIDTLIKKVGAEFDALADELGFPAEDESPSESEDTSGDECVRRIRQDYYRQGDCERLSQAKTVSRRCRKAPTGASRVWMSLV